MLLPKTLLAVVVLLISAHLALAQKPEDTLPTAPEGKTWKLVWHDEFDGTKLDETKWDVPPDGKRRDAYWMRKAISLDGKGHLVIGTLYFGLDTGMISKEVNRRHYKKTEPQDEQCAHIQPEKHGGVVGTGAGTVSPFDNSSAQYSGRIE